MNDNVKSWLFVGVQFLILALLFVPNTNQNIPSSTVLFLGSILLFVGSVLLVRSLYDLRKSLTALPKPTANGSFQPLGSYAFVRHPMYTAVLTITAGVVMIRFSLLNLVLFVLLMLLFNSKARYEEGLLINKYSEYKKYMSKTPRFIPRSRKKK